jgi:hypothetical protein
VYEVGHPLHLSFGIAPSSKDISLELKLDDTVVYKLSALGIEDVRYHRKKHRESLKLIISPKESVSFRIRPQISIWRNDQR